MLNTFIRSAKGSKLQLGIFASQRLVFSDIDKHLQRLVAFSAYIHRVWEDGGGGGGLDPESRANFK